MDSPTSPAAFDNPLYSDPGDDYLVSRYIHIYPSTFTSVCLQTNPVYDGYDDEV